MQGVPLLIVANKQDMVQAFSVEEINGIFELEKIQDRKWIVIGSEKDDLSNFNEGLSWLISELK